MLNRTELAVRWTIIFFSGLTFIWIIVTTVDLFTDKLGRQEICAQISETLQAYDDCVNARIEEREK